MEGGFIPISPGEGGKTQNCSYKREVHYVPHHLLHDILLKLPTKSLLRFKTVSKNWCTKISEPDFEEFQLQRCLSKILILHQFPRLTGFDSFLYKFEDKGLRARKFAATDLLIGRGCTFPATRSCNSLILLRNSFFVRERIWRLHSDNDENWRMLNIPFPQKILPYEAVAVGGVLYWTTTGFIQSMDISREEFMGRIEVPCKRDEAYFGLMEIKGSLSLMNRASDNKLEIWVLKNEGCWIKQHKFSPSLKSAPKSHNISVGFCVAFESCKGTYLLVCYDYTTFWYSLNTEELTPIAVDESQYCSGQFCLLWLL
ncbi:F-box domain-containing protein [Melia azedarach]|uniref:F-box domain-containing protein n=1 Tax=Melia azedarach TaxID=155640 RepID=A0ACC1XZZ3_MELAZ|nr:F-box domain-containing protein [Melia azedarach]